MKVMTNDEIPWGSATTEFQDPFDRFARAIARAQSEGVDTAPAALGTADRRGRPSVRMVLLRGADPRGFVFHTNYNSRKAQDLTENAYAALCLHWPTLEEQIRIEGSVVRLASDESDAYFAGRPRESQIGAWASDQSAVLPDRSVLEERFRESAARFDGQPVQRPPFWGGFRIVPDRIEFWYGGTNRLHDRIVYVREGADWRTERLFP
jgi:pyridoxamine 5'-phosphate oxidase